MATTPGKLPAGTAEAGSPIETIHLLERRAPRSAGIAGILFSVLFATSLLLLATARPPDGLDAEGLADWFRANALTSVTIAALYLAPFAGIAFLWFIGVVRDRIGAREDRFFAAVFMIVTSTIAWRTAVFPRLLALIGYGIATVMLLSLSFLQWIVLLFPVWVFAASAYVLSAELRAARAARSQPG